VVRAQLQARLPPPAAQLEAFFDAAPPGGGGDDEEEQGRGRAAPAAPYSLCDLESIVRTLLLLGHSPSERWLRGLVAVVSSRREEMDPQQLRGFVEGLRWAPEAAAWTGLGPPRGWGGKGAKQPVRTARSQNPRPAGFSERHTPARNCATRWRCLASSASEALTGGPDNPPSLPPLCHTPGCLCFNRVFPSQNPKLVHTTSVLCSATCGFAHHPSSCLLSLDPRAAHRRSHLKPCSPALTASAWPLPFSPPFR
jgi:hypothetical protein